MLDFNARYIMTVDNGATPHTLEQERKGGS